MHAVALADETDFEGWRRAAREMLARHVPPDALSWTTHARPDLLATDTKLPPRDDGPPAVVPRGFIVLAEAAALHCDPQRFALLYRLLWRLRQTPDLLALASDPDVAALDSMARAVHRDIHKMRAFIRFRHTRIGSADRHVAWFEPAHHILRANAPFFVRRFANMAWSILTPAASAHWDGDTLAFGPGAARADAPREDAMEALWRDYYASIFNPARLKVAAMRAEMPVRYWGNLPEARLIRPLIAQARQRTSTMIATAQTTPRQKRQRAATPAPQPEAAGSIAALREEAASCRRCPLWEHATQTVFGEGQEDTPVMFVGEQPGDQEDLKGRPFVGPAGKMFDRALAEAGIDRARAYVTNAVKHFKFVPRGKRRLHAKPNSGEVIACRFWLSREIAALRPRLIVALGATAAQSLFGRPTPVGSSRGRVTETAEAKVLVTVHPSYLLRLPDAAAQESEYERFVADLRLVRPFLEDATPAR